MWLPSLIISKPNLKLHFMTDSYVLNACEGNKYCTITPTFGMFVYVVTSIRRLGYRKGD